MNVFPACVCLFVLYILVQRCVCVCVSLMFVSPSVHGISAEQQTGLGWPGSDIL